MNMFCVRLSKGSVSVCSQDIRHSIKIPLVYPVTRGFKDLDACLNRLRTRAQQGKFNETRTRSRSSASSQTERLNRFRLWITFLKTTIQIKTTEQNFAVVPFITLYEVFLTFESVVLFITLYKVVLVSTIFSLLNREIM